MKVETVYNGILSLKECFYELEESNAIQVNMCKT